MLTQPTRTPQPLFAQLASAAWNFSQRRWQLVVVAMLLLLHVAVFRGVADPWARALLLAHLGLVLLWQPFVRAEQRVSGAQGAMLLVIALVVMLRLDWWLLAFWVVVIAGLVGGKVYQHHGKWQRRCYLVVLVYLLALLAIAILPEVAPRREITTDTRALAEFLLPFAFVLIAVFPAETQRPEVPQIIDFFYSVFLMLLLVVVILGSFTFMTLRQSGYLEALTYTVFSTAAAVLLVGLAWTPRAGEGLGVFFVRYLFSIGVPLEQWLAVLARLLREEAEPERFLEQAISALERLPSVAGVSWRAGAGQGERGTPSAHAVEFASDELRLCIYSRYRLTPALRWHLHLLGQLLAEFYLAKLGEAKLRETMYLRAVHETGARTTHDIKNLLQSLSVLCSAAAADDVDAERLNALVRRQLPLVAERLNETLGRLQRPQPQGHIWVSPAQWWQALTRQYQSEAVEFAAPAVWPEQPLPRELFDSVADNLIRNALAKRRQQPTVRVRVSLQADALRVCDTGPGVPPEVAKSMLRAPVTSDTGLGIGLYQAARQAEVSGYRLQLEKNEDGEVCFALRRVD
ncbi:MAG: sensor histidine kinase [Burkholderiales bacterium]